MQILYLIKDFYPEYIKNSRNSSEKTNSLIFLTEQEFGQMLQEEGIQTANKHVKIGTLFFRETQTKTTM